MNETAKPGAGCPICGRKPEARLRPFCSRRCADVDLGRWLTGIYRAPGEAVAEEDGAEAAGVDRQGGIL
jgi:hypothetical protein